MYLSLTLMFVYLANLIAEARIVLYFISSVFVMGVLMERMFVRAFLLFVIVVIAGFLMVPVKTGMLPYLFFFGHYGIFKYFIEGGYRTRSSVMILKIIYFTVCMSLILWQTGDFMWEGLPFILPWWGYLAAGEVIFVIYDFLFTKLSAWYYAALRPRLISTGTF